MFDGGILAAYSVAGNNPVQLLDLDSKIESQGFGSWTNIYGCAIEALKVVYGYAASDQLPAVILLTDGEHNSGESYGDLERFFEEANHPVPVFSIMMGGAVERELKAIAELTNGEVCDGRGGEDDLVRCFRTFKGSN